MKPIVIVNFKCYDEATGKNGLKLAAYCSTYDNVIICPQAIDLDNVSMIPGLTVYSQHVDPILDGPYTGKMSVNAIKKAGAKGSLIYHPEDKTSLVAIKAAVELLRKNGLKSVVCSESLEEATSLTQLRPDYISFEPKELIGTTQSIANLQPEMIEKIAKAIKPTKLLVGAGIHSPEEIREIMKRGAVGVLVSSSVIKSKNPRQIIRELANA